MKKLINFWYNRPALYVATMSWLSGIVAGMFIGSIYFRSWEWLVLLASLALCLAYVSILAAGVLDEATDMRGSIEDAQETEESFMRNRIISVTRPEDKEWDGFL